VGTSENGEGNGSSDTTKVSSYEELVAAITAADGATTIELTADITFHETLEIASGKDITLTGQNGFSLTLTFDESAETAGHISVLGNLALKDIAVHSTSGTDSGNLVTVNSTGSLTLDNASFDMTSCGDSRYDPQYMIDAKTGSTVNVYSAAIGSAASGSITCNDSNSPIQFLPIGAISCAKLDCAFTVTQQEGYPISTLTVGGDSEASLTGGVYTSSSGASSLAITVGTSENGEGGGSGTKTYVLQVQKSEIAMLHGQITLSYTVSGQPHTLDSSSTNSVRDEAIPADTQVTVTAIPAKGYQLTRLAYNYSYPSTTSASVSPTNLVQKSDSTQSENLDYGKAITTTFTMPEANVYVTASFGSVTGNGEPKVNQDSSSTYSVYGTGANSSTLYGSYTISSEYRTADTDVDTAFFYSEDRFQNGTTGASAAVLTAQVKVTPNSEDYFFVRA
jgi:hypothetical protein